MNYRQLELQVRASEAESLSEQLEALGALSVALQDAKDDPIYEPEPQTHPLWDDIIIIGLFAEDAPMADIVQSLQNHVGMIPIRQSVLKDENWVEKSLTDFKPIEITPTFWICPSWQQVNNPHATVLRLNPGLAFGTGEHPTTQMILKQLAINPPRNNTVLDFGCGSGILAIGAQLLGAKMVYAVDIDPQALIATQNNLELNHIPSHQISISLPDALENVQVDLLLANIFLVPLLQLQQKFINLVKPGGEILLSGILSTQFEQIFTTYQDHFSLTIIDQQHEWLLVQGFAKNN